MTGAVQQAPMADVLIYSADISTRQAVMNAVGRRAGKNSPEIRWSQAATSAGAIELVEQQSFDLIIVDGETPKVGGMALAKQLEVEFDALPPIIALIARQQDEWLAQWAGVQAILSEPLDPIAIQEAVATALQEV